VFRQRNLQFALRKMFDENFALSFVVLFVEEAFGFFRLWFCRWFALLVFILISVVLYSPTAIPPPSSLFFAFGETKKGGRRIRERATRAKL